jgi:hypothetical protein
MACDRTFVDRLERQHLSRQGADGEPRLPKQLAHDSSLLHCFLSGGIDVESYARKRLEGLEACYADAEVSCGHAHHWWLRSAADP